MSKRTPKINIIVHLPASEEGKIELASRIACIHADAVLNRIKNLKCSSKQKNKLLDAIIADAQKASDDSFTSHRASYSSDSTRQTRSSPFPKYIPKENLYN